MRKTLNVPWDSNEFKPNFKVESTESTIPSKFIVVYYLIVPKEMFGN